MTRIKKVFLNEDRFERLVRGEEVVFLSGETEIHIILDDIGFEVMARVITSAAIDPARERSDEEIERSLDLKRFVDGSYCRALRPDELHYLERKRKEKS